MFTAHSQGNQGDKRGGEYTFIPPREKPLFHLGKRFFDVVVSLMAAIIFLLPVLVLSLLIRLESPGPAIYHQRRLGLGGKPFVLYKLRSMHRDAEKNGPQMAAENDSRCTRIGAFLRESHLDELPQLWNVLKGDMSLVGPRPERACFHEEITAYLPEFRERLTVKPGLTGWAQVQGTYHISPKQKLQFDQYYISNMSWSLDLYCLFLTLCKIVRKGIVR